MPYYVAFHLGLHCLPEYPFRGFQYTKGQRFEYIYSSIGDFETYRICITLLNKNEQLHSTTACLKLDLSHHGFTGQCLTADPGVTSSIPARSLTFVEVDHEIISIILLSFAGSRRFVISYKRKCVHEVLG